MSAELLQYLRAAGIPAGPANSETNCGTIRINIAGNKIGTLITPTNVTPLERLFRRFPEEGTLTASPSQPFSFEIGAISVPAQMSFVLLDWRFAIYVPSGIAAGDSRELEDRRLSQQVAYDVKFTDTRPDNVSFQIDPSYPAPATSTFAPMSNAGVIPGNGISGVPQSLFDQLRTSSASTRTAGLSARPQRHRRDSQLEMPFTYVVSENRRVNFEVSIFRPIPIPIAFFEVEACGFFIGQNAIQDFVESIRPCVSKGSI